MTGGESPNTMSLTHSTATVPADRPITVRSLFERSVNILASAGVTDPQVDAELLIGHVLGASRGRVQSLTVTDAPIGVEDTVAIIEAVERRAAREPLQHITGRAWFRSLELAVGPGVFVPRPETEFVAQLGIDALRAVVPAPDARPRAVDLGTGSGAIALALATEVPHAEIAAVENSSAAFVWAKENFRAVGAENARLVFIDLADALPELDGTVDVVVSNPPYIPAGAIPRDPEVRSSTRSTRSTGEPTASTWCGACPPPHAGSCARAARSSSSTATSRARGCASSSRPTAGTPWRPTATSPAGTAPPRPSADRSSGGRDDRGLRGSCDRYARSAATCAHHPNRPGGTMEIGFAFGIVGLIIFIVTVVSIVNNPNHGGLGKFVWILVAFFLSILGSILWFIFGRGRVNK